MKFTDESKEKSGKTEIKEEAKAISGDVRDGAEKSGINLDDAELDQVSGGGGWFKILP